MRALVTFFCIVISLGSTRAQNNIRIEVQIVEMPRALALQACASARPDEVLAHDFDEIGAKRIDYSVVTAVEGETGVTHSKYEVIHPSEYGPSPPPPDLGLGQKSVQLPLLRPFFASFVAWDCWMLGDSLTLKSPMPQHSSWVLERQALSTNLVWMKHCDLWGTSDIQFMQPDSMRFLGHQKNSGQWQLSNCIAARKPSGEISTDSFALVFVRSTLLDRD